METEKLVVNGVTYIREDLANLVSTDGLKVVLIRSYASGVHYGCLKEVQDVAHGRIVTLVNSRRIWEWDGAASLSQIAVDGVKKPEGTKITVAVPEIEIMDVIEIIPMTAAAVENLNSVPEWKI